jgi:glyoxylase-like metal-dependent hydrolase (beta-lactamase superfamily II)
MVVDRDGDGDVNLDVLPPPFEPALHERYAPHVSIAVTPLTIAEGLRMLSLRTPTLPPATHTNVFLVGSGEFVLVEPASPFKEEIEKAAAWVQEERDRGLTLRAILLTHHHGDHAGGATALRELLKVPLWAHEGTAERLHGKVQFDRLLEHGERIELAGPTPLALDVVHTPGHAPGHLCFHERTSGALIAGDMVASVGTILVEPRDGDMSLYLESLEAMQALDARVLLPAHGLPIADANARLRFYVQHRLAREAKVLAALVERGGAATVHELVPIAYADTSPVAWPLAAMSTEAHLLKLEDDGRVERQGSKWLALASA